MILKQYGPLKVDIRSKRKTYLSVLHSHNVLMK